MRQRTYALMIFVMIAALLAGCGGSGGPGAIFGGNTVKVSLVYGSEKREWLEPLVKQYNDAQHKTKSGSTIVVEATPLGSIEAVEGLLAGQLQPTVWSPASSIYIPVANEQWRQKSASDLVVGTPKDLVLSPVVIAIWKPMAEA